MKMGATTTLVRHESAEVLAWDGEWWNMRIGRATTLMDDWARENTIGCMWLLIPTADTDGIRRAEDGGARIMDVRVELDKPVTSPRMAYLNYTNDIDALVPLARTAFRGLTRFYADPRFPDERCDDLYENWLRTSHASGDVVLTAPARPDKGTPGFVLVHVDGDTASIVLIAVEEWARGEGVGAGLVGSACAHAHEQGCSRMTVVTQGRNIAAQRTFQRLGFKTSQVDVWLHQWM